MVTLNNEHSANREVQITVRNIERVSDSEANVETEIIYLR